MRTPELVGDCIASMKAAVDVPVTVKCRIGVDEQDEETALDALAGVVFAAGADALWVHARKAWLEGLSPKENRDIPPLNYERVYRLKRKLPGRFIGINGGIPSLDAGLAHLAHVDGVMLGRAAYHEPMQLLRADELYFGTQLHSPDISQIIDAMAAYCARHIEAGGRLSHVTRHMVGLFHGQPGARRFRQILSEDASRPGVGPEVLLRAFGAVAKLEETAA